MKIQQLIPYISRLCLMYYQQYRTIQNIQYRYDEAIQFANHTLLNTYNSLYDNMEVVAVIIYDNQVIDVEGNSNVEEVYNELYTALSNSSEDHTISNRKASLIQLMVCPFDGFTLHPHTIMELFDLLFL